MDDLSSYFYIAVGQLLDQAAVGRLHVHVELVDGRAAEGVPSIGPPQADAELDETGYPRHVSVGGDVVPLDGMVRVTVVHPDASTPER